MKTFLYDVRISSVEGHKNPIQTTSNIKGNLLDYAIRNWKCKTGFWHGWMETFNECIQNLPLLLQLLALLFFHLALFSSSLSSCVGKDDHQQPAPNLHFTDQQLQQKSVSLFSTVLAKFLQLNLISGSWVRSSRLRPRASILKLA